MIVVVAAFSANADVYWFVGESGASWQDVNNYRLGSRSGSVPTSLPGGSDLVMAGSTSSSNPTTVEVSAEDIDFVAALKGVSVRNCRLTLNVATNSHFSCAIAGMSDTGGFSRSGTVVKQGAGDMYLDSVNSYIASGRPADYLCDTFCVSNGNVYLLKDTAWSGDFAFFGSRMGAEWFGDLRRAAAQIRRENWKIYAETLIDELEKAAEHRDAHRMTGLFLNAFDNHMRLIWV